MKILIFILVVLIACLLQASILDYACIFRVKPDLLLIAAVIAALNFDLKPACALSVFSGLLKDCFTCGPFGINTVLFFLLTFAIVKLSKKMPLEYEPVSLGLTLIASFMFNLFYGIVLIYHGSIIPAGVFLRVSLLASLYTVLVYPLMNKLSVTFLDYFFIEPVRNEQDKDY